MNYTIAWITWGLAFAAIEGAALLDRRPGGTLSEHIWKWFAVRRGKGGGWGWQRVVLLLALVWLTGHLAFGWWPA